MKHPWSLHHAAAVSCLLLCVTVAQAQHIDEVDVKRSGTDRVLTIRFTSPIKLLRSVSTANSPLTQIYYQTSTREELNPQTKEYPIKGANNNGLVVLIDQHVGPAINDRKLVLRSVDDNQAAVRLGRGDRTLEVILKGLGPQNTAEPRVLPNAPTTPLASSSAEVNALLNEAKKAMAQGDNNAAIQKLEQLLDLPSQEATEEAQALIGKARWQQGDLERAVAEFELYLKLHPNGPEAERVRQSLATLKPDNSQVKVTEQAPNSRNTSEITGSLSLYYFGGQSQARTQDFIDSPLGGLPQLASDSVLSGADQKMFLTSLDMTWRQRTDEADSRFVVRNSYTLDQLRPEKSKNKLSALYFDYRQRGVGYNLRLGRQSPQGGGVMGRFDGVVAGYRFHPKWRVNVSLGEPTDSLLKAKRYFYGASLDMDEITPRLGGAVYVLEQRIDQAVDRRALGAELRYLKDQFSAISILDYDQVLKGLNIAMFQGTWQWEDNSNINVMFDRRTTPMLTLGNSLFFQNPALLVQATNMTELLASQSLATLRQSVKNTTPYSTQAMVAYTKPLTEQWQLGMDARLTNIGALQPVPDILPNGQPGTGNIYSTGLQLIGTNLYSKRDTHVVMASLLKAPTYQGLLLSYNNSSGVGEKWTIDPSLRYYQQSDTTGARIKRWSPGLRFTYRATQKVVVESDLNMEFSQTTSLTRNENTRRLFYFIGLRYEF
ncbi:MAG: hypothetical protein RJA09_1891 [Pseudomonadota bacterium]